jgi:hypothetical protein
MMPTVPDSPRETQPQDNRLAAPPRADAGRDAPETC